MGHSVYDLAFAERRRWKPGCKIEAKRALKPQQVWAIRFWLDRSAGCEIGRCLIWQSIASSGVATWSR